MSATTPLDVQRVGAASRLSGAELDAVRHGRATGITIQLATRQDLVRRSVTDNGSGMPQPPPSDQGMGLRIMAYRARMLGGELHLFDRDPRGSAPGEAAAVETAMTQMPAYHS